MKIYNMENRKDTLAQIKALIRIAIDIEKKNLSSDEKVDVSQIIGFVEIGNGEFLFLVGREAMVWLFEEIEIREKEAGRWKVRYNFLVRLLEKAYGNQPIEDVNRETPLKRILGILKDEGQGMGAKLGRDAREYLALLVYTPFNLEPDKDEALSFFYCGYKLKRKACLELIDKDYARVEPDSCGGLRLLITESGRRQAA